MNINPLARSKDLVIQEMGDELMVYDLKTNKAICLNQTSAFIWQNCDGNRDAQDIVKLIKKKFGSMVEEDFVWLALSQLKKENLLDNNILDKFEGLSRREVIKRVGLGSLVALPIIASLTAPQASYAASTCGTSCTCEIQEISPAGGICATAAGMAGVACPAAPAGCQTCRTTAAMTAGNTSAGMCFTS